MKQVKLGVIGLAVVAAGGIFCSAQAQFGGGPTDPPAVYQAMLVNNAGTTLGPAGLWASPEGVQVTMRVEFLSPGSHVVKIDSVGKCNGPTFDAVGAPVGTAPNISINGNGFGYVDFTLTGVSMESLMDADGAAITIEDADGKVACGVFKKPVMLAPRAAPRAPRPQQ